METTPVSPAPVPAPAKKSILATILKSAGAIAAGGGMVFLTGLQNGQSAKTAGYSAGAAALATVIAYLTKAPHQQ